VKRLSTGVLAALVVAGLGLSVLAPLNVHAQGNIGHLTVAQDTSAAPPANFGSPPSGSVPILFNDHHVYTKPDILKQSRVLAALVQGGTILIPLRSMFEQMGATVSYDPGTKTVDVTKAGADVKVTVGKPEVVINGETRPLDVPPEMYNGVVLVPVRVISEGMGAYVEWEPDKRLVVVRYMPATPPPPTPAPTEAPTMAPTPAPTATPYKDAFIVGDYIFSPKIYNEFSPGNTGKSGSYSGRAALEFDAFNIPWMIEGDYRQFQYPHNANPPNNINIAFVPNCPSNPGCVTVIGGQGMTLVPAFTARDQYLEGRLGVRVVNPRVYIGVGYIYKTGNYGYPRLANWGAGIEKLPDLDQQFSFYASAYYYPNVRGTCGTTVCPTGPFVLSYNMFTYEVGVNWVPNHSPVYLDLGYLGDNGTNKSNAPVGFTESGPYAGIGIKF